MISSDDNTLKPENTFTKDGVEVEKEEEGDEEEIISEEGLILKKPRFKPTWKEINNVCYKIFKCKRPKYDVRKFSILDKLNNFQNICGFLCKREGKIGGSLLIASVKEQTFETDKRQFIFGTPKLKYAYKRNENEFVDEFEGENLISSYYLSQKWNGTNILLFKYYDIEGNEFISAKTKGMPTVNDGDFGNFLTGTLQALHLDQFIGKYKNFYLREVLLKIHSDKNNEHYNEHIYEFLMNNDVQSISFEICGHQMPHLVKYDFDISLKPLFVTFKESGKIKPCIHVKDMEEFGPFPYTPKESHEKCVEHCKRLQKESLQKNEKYREENHLKHKYEYEHFAVEGHVLYLLDKDGYLIYRTMYKIKPNDVEEVHWETFDERKKGQVKDTIIKMKQRNLNISDESVLRNELDIGDKEWGKFGKDIKKYIQFELNEDIGYEEKKRHYKKSNIKNNTTEQDDNKE
ncbi:hypothetical protein ABK040_003894 [Willaertia magna]